MKNSCTIYVCIIKLIYKIFIIESEKMKLDFMKFFIIRADVFCNLGNLPFPLAVQISMTLTVSSIFFTLAKLPLNMFKEV